MNRSLHATALADGRPATYESRTPGMVTLGHGGSKLILDRRKQAEASRAAGYARAPAAGSSAAGCTSRMLEAGLDGKLHVRHAQLLVRRDGLALPDFKLVQMFPALYRIRKNRLHAVLLYDRVANYHLVNSFLLLIFITLSELTTWAVTPDDVGSRLELSFTLLLVAVGFKNLIVNDMPQVAYLTILDYYSISSISFLLLATINHAVVGKVGVQYLTGDSSAEHLQLVDLISFCSFLLLWLLMNTAFLVLAKGQLHWNSLLAAAEIPRRLGFAEADEARADDDESYHQLRARAAAYSIPTQSRRRTLSDTLPKLFSRTCDNNRVPIMHALSRRRRQKAELALSGGHLTKLGAKSVGRKADGRALLPDEGSPKLNATAMTAPELDWGAARGTVIEGRNASTLGRLPNLGDRQTTPRGKLGTLDKRVGSLNRGCADSASDAAVSEGVSEDDWGVSDRDADTDRRSPTPGAGQSSPAQESEQKGGLGRLCSNNV